MECVLVAAGGRGQLGRKGRYSDFSEMQAQCAAISPMKRMGDGWDIANAALFLASDEANHITGIDLCVDGGLRCKTH